jgi:hypothetical protein
MIIVQQEEINILRRQLSVNQSDTVFTSGVSGVSVEQFSKMSVRDRLRLMRQVRKASSMRDRNDFGRLIEPVREPFQIEQ